MLASNSAAGTATFLPLGSPPASPGCPLAPASRRGFSWATVLEEAPPTCRPQMAVILVSRLVAVYPQFGLGDCRHHVAPGGCEPACVWAQDEEAWPSLAQCVWLQDLRTGRNRVSRKLA